MLDFYGFNGYQSNYIPVKDMAEDGMFAYLPDEAGAKLEEKGKYPKGFYRFGRDLIKAKIDFTGEIARNFYWEAGYNLSWTRTSDFTPKGYEVLAGKDFEHGTTLFDLYKAWGIIPESQAEGGFVSSIRAGLMYDSRNIENNPTKGIWAEAHVIAAPKWLGTTDPHYKFCATFRHYVPIVQDKLTFAYRAAYQGTFGSRSPWYVMPFYTNMGPKADNDGFGGYRTVRGLMLNRVQGEDVGFFNAELRWRFIDFKLWKQNIAFAVSGFADGAHVFRGYDMENKTGRYQDIYNQFVLNRKDGFHGAAGAGTAQVEGRDEETRTPNPKALFSQNKAGVDEPANAGNPFAKEGEDKASGTGSGLKPKGFDQLDTGLQGRGLREDLPRPAYPGTKSGKVLIRVTVNAEGRVTGATFEPKGSTTSDAQMVDAAIEAARKARFTESAAVVQGGTITYVFRLE